ncbi:ParB/Srx family N-terminal domain-containing protein [Mangrovibacter phragmitis]|uniref:ParB/Srx family N-terminal domain-containing protein n=1 Tax=Mangrovibacter phragmitis TaxID=1691903 RepID=UPI003514FEA0
MTEVKNTSELSIVYKEINRLIPYALNARTHSEEQIEQLKASIREFGWTNPVLIDEHGVIIAGHGRVLAADALGIVVAPTITLSGLSEIQKKAYRLADNRLPMNAGWDSELLRLELTGIIEDGFDIQLAGFSEQEIDELLIELPDSPIGENDYTTKIDTPVYEPSGTVPEVTALYDESKTSKLRENIEQAEVPADIKRFLLSAAERHTVFDFSKIADFYAASAPNVQALFEESALVIIDYEKAIEHGFVHLTKKMIEIVYGGQGDNDAR